MHDHAGIQVSAHFVEHLDHCDLVLAREIFRSLKACDAASDYDDILAGRRGLSAEDLLRRDRAFNARNRGQDRSAAGCHEDGLRTRRPDHCGVSLHAQAHVYACFLQLRLHGLDEFVDHSFVRRDRREVCGSAELILRFEQNSVKPAFGQCQCSFHAGGAAAYDRHCAAGAIFDKLFVAVFKFPSEDRVECAPQRKPVVEDPEALHAAKTFTDQDVLAGFRFFAPVRVCQMASRNSDKVNSAVFEHLLGESRVFDVADRDDGDLHSLSDVGGEVDLPALRKVAGLNDRRAGIVGAAADVYAADSEGFEIFCLGDAVFFSNTVGEIVTAVHAD